MLVRRLTQGAITLSGLAAVAVLSWFVVQSIPSSQAALSSPTALFGVSTKSDAGTANRLQVASMNVDSEILEGKSTSILNKGLWRIPGSSTPDKGGNTVIAAHRWKWLPISKKSFYDINKVKVGDPISLQWQGKEYRYQVTKISTVTPDRVDILGNSKTAKLTLFTCTPLFSSKYRLVVEAEPIT